MENFSKLGGELDCLLRLRTPSLGIKMFKKIEDIPAEFENVDYMVKVCQVIGMARYKEKPMAGTKESATACAMGGAYIGLYPIPDNLIDGTRNVGSWTKDAQAGKKLIEGRIFLERGKFEAFGVCPLKIMSIEPDVVQVFGTPEQMLACVYANIWDGGDRLELATNGHGASCNEVLTVPYVTGRMRLAIADIGERRDAGADTNDMIIGLPVSQLERIVKNLKEAFQGAYKYPFIPRFAPLPESVLKRVGK